MTENFGCNELLTWDICWGYKPEKSSSLLKVKTKQTKPWRPFPSCSACSSTWDMDLNSTILHLSRIMGPQDLKVDVGENMIKQRIVASIVQKSIWNELNSYQSPTTLELSASWCFQTWWATQETVLGNLQSLETGTWVLGSIHDAEYRQVYGQVSGRTFSGKAASHRREAARSSAAASWNCRSLSWKTAFIRSGGRKSW